MSLPPSELIYPLASDAVPKQHNSHLSEYHGCGQATPRHRSLIRNACDRLVALNVADGFAIVERRNVFILSSGGGP